MSDCSELELILKRNKMGESHILLGYVFGGTFHFCFSDSNILGVRRIYAWTNYRR